MEEEVSAMEANVSANFLLKVSLCPFQDSRSVLIQCSHSVELIRMSMGASLGSCPLCPSPFGQLNLIKG